MTSMKSLPPKHFKNLHIKFALALGFVALALFSSSFLIQKAINENVSDSSLINISGRQRMLSQKISKVAIILEASKDKTLISQMLTELDEALSLWVRSQMAIQFGDKSMGIPPRKLSKEVSQLLDKIKPYQLKIVKAAEMISSTTMSEDISDETKRNIIAENVSSILQTEKLFLPLMDKITFTFDKEAKEKIQKLKFFERMILLVGLLVLLLEYIFIFKPSTTQLNLAVDDVVEKQKLLKEANDALVYALDESKRLEDLANAASNAKSTFLANMSHEIRTPMNSILGFAEILDSKISDPLHKHYLDNMVSSGKMLLALINDVLDLSKIEAGKLNMNFRSVDLHKICTEIAETFRHMAEKKGLDFIFSIEKEIPKALILDEIRIRQILFNLLGNAVKFTDKGHISFAVSIYGFSEKHSNYNLLITIEDTGIGIPKNALSTIFEAFEQQSKQDHRKYGGTGLGLSITQKLVSLMNGEIWVDSTEGKGSKFSIRIDKVHVASVIQDESEKNMTYHFSPAKVLIVDDVDINRELIAEYLYDEPFEMSFASNGEEALSEIAKNIPDIILTDMRMPKMDGFELTKKLKSMEKTKDIKVIAITASSLNLSEKSIRETCDGYLQKPITAKKLFSEMAIHLKANKKDEKRTAITAITHEDFTCETSDIKGMLSVFTDTFLSNLNNQIEILSYDELVSIIKHVRSTAEDYSCSILINWCDEATKSLEIFDMEQLEQDLKQFEPILNKIKEKL